MNQKTVQFILAVVIGIVALVIVSMSLMALITSNTFSVVYAILTTSAIFLVFGIGVGLFWRDGYLRAGAVLVSPFIAVTLLSVLFGGNFQKFLTNDIPALVTAFLAGAIGCFFGQKIGTKLRTQELK